MTESGSLAQWEAQQEASALLNSRLKSRSMTTAEREVVITKGEKFAEHVGGKGASCLLIAGDLNSDGEAPEQAVRDRLIDAFGYPKIGTDGVRKDSGKTINVLLHSPGGSLDSAFKIVLYLSRYARILNVYVPFRAKSASTLIALGATSVRLSPFGELGPLDAQIRDPRDPAKPMSALDCYQSVDYVRRFAFNTMTEAQKSLSAEARGQLAFRELIGTASQFATNSTAPMLQAVTALDFGAWGRTLKIGEEYARRLVIANGFEDERGADIARALVYAYTHHSFPIDFGEAQRLGLPVELMDSDAYSLAKGVVDACCEKAFIGFISKNEAAASMKHADAGGSGVDGGTSGTPQARNPDEPDDGDN